MIRKIGKIGRANTEARRIIADIAEDKGLYICEIKIPGICEQTFGIAPAHRHKRSWYNGDVKKLSDIKQWVAACYPCHARIEDSRKMTEEVFMKLRGKE